MAGDSVTPAMVAKLKKRISTTKGLFTRTETKIKTLQVKGNESVGNTLLQKLDTYALEVADLYEELIDMVDEKEKSALEDIMNALDVDYHHRATTCLMQFTALPVDFPAGPATRQAVEAREAPPRVQFREQQGLRPALLLVTSSMSECILVG